MSGKPYRIRVRVLDGKPRDQKALNKLKSSELGMPYLDIVDAKGGVELIICASKETHLVQVREKLRSAGLEEIEGGDTTIPEFTSSTWVPQGSRQGTAQQNRLPPGGRQQPRGAQPRAEPAPPDLKKKPYGFVSLPEELKSDSPVWHDGTCSKGRLSGEIRFELVNLTPLLVGWERGTVGDGEADWPVPPSLQGVGQLSEKKSVLCPLRAPWGKRPVIIPGDTLKGLLRHELGALLGAPMERVAERSYSYRPNAMYPNRPGAYLVPRLARIPHNGVRLVPLSPDKGAVMVRVPTRLELLPAGLQYNKKANKFDFVFDSPTGSPYRGGQGAGRPLNSKHPIHTSIQILKTFTVEAVDIPEKTQEGYLATLRHLTDPDHGHFAPRHPDVPKVITTEDARKRILEAAQNEVFKPGDIVWVEWDTEENEVVSFGWHYYYRWAYVDTVRRDADAPNGERYGLFPLPEERQLDAEGAPQKLSLVRRLFGYTGDNEGSSGIGKDDYAQLMARISINAALEVVEEGDTEDKRFLPPTFLKELGMPRPSAVEFYLKQPYHPNPRPSDQATLVTYGDAAGYDEPGELAGRKFYLDRQDAYSGEPWKDDSQGNRANERSTLVLEASQPERRFRFTLRFRDLDAAELAAILVALCPHQFREVLKGTHPEGYCSKLGYARPLGWGSVRIEAKALLWLQEANGKPALRPEPDPVAWVKKHYQKTPTQEEWLAVHRHKHPDARDYPRKDGEIYTFHTTLRAAHSRMRRYRR